MKTFIPVSVKKNITSMWLEISIPTLIIVGFTLFSVHEIHQGQAINKIKGNGKRVSAHVTDIYQGTCGKSGCGIYAKYSFSPKGDGSKIFFGTARLGDTRDLNSRDIRYAKFYGSIPIAYEIGNPQNSQENFADSVFVRDHLQDTYFGIRVVGQSILLPFLIMFGWWIFRHKAIKRRIHLQRKNSAATRVP